MAKVNSVLGPIDTADLGFTLMHEHMAVFSWAMRHVFPDSDAPIIEVALKMRENRVGSRARASDLDCGTWRRLAEEYEASSDIDSMIRYRAAECWALAGEPARSMEILNHLVDVGWLNPDLAYLLQSWPFKRQRGEREWAELVLRLKKK